MMNDCKKVIGALVVVVSFARAGYADAPAQVTRIGAVAYSPAAVTIFHDLTRYLNKNGLPSDYVL